MKVPKNATKVYKDLGTGEVYGYAIAGERPFKCKGCKKLLNGLERQLVEDPYLSEIHNVVEKGRWCKDCYHEMCMDI